MTNQSARTTSTCSRLKITRGYVTSTVTLAAPIAARFERVAEVPLTIRMVAKIGTIMIMTVLEMMNMTIQVIRTIMMVEMMMTIIGVIHGAHTISVDVEFSYFVSDSLPVLNVLEHSIYMYLE